MASTLVSRNIVVSGHRTSMRLERAMWDALFEVCRRERKTIHAICTHVDESRDESSLTAALRVFIMTYFRLAATEDGHHLAGYGMWGPSGPHDDRGIAAIVRDGTNISA
jgi:predicted DNA-binding ribbon-helix-helix protein